jgi:ATP-dependent DNA helicase RecQ
MLYGLQDVAHLRGLLDQSEADEAVKRVEHRKLESLLAYCETARCRRQVLLEYFDEPAGACGNCDTCLNPPATVDGSFEARLALSAVYRTGQGFGAGHVIDVLMGKTTDKVTRWGHDGLALFGKGAEIAEARWRSVLRQLAAAGLVQVDLAAHGSLKLGAGELVRPVLRGEHRFELTVDRAPRAETRRGGAATGQTDRRGQAVGAGPPLSDAQQALFDRLRATRTELAKAQGVPPYVVFHDSTLTALAREKPQTLDAFAATPGVGARKVERYAEAFLDVLRQG